MPSSLHLDSASVIATAELLNRRIRERFPARSLTGIADDLVSVSADAAHVAKRLRRPMIWYRLLTCLGVAALLALLFLAFFHVNPEADSLGWDDFLTLFEAAVNDAIFLALAIWFLATLERRFKRSRALDLLHKLRSLAHVIDMHQLTKDPDSIAGTHHATASSPVRDLTPYELKRYLDYCSEMLSIVGKLAALMAQDFDDSLTLQAVNEIEDLTSGLSRKIWQKMILISGSA